MPTSPATVSVAISGQLDAVAAVVGPVLIGALAAALVSVLVLVVTESVGGRLVELEVHAVAASDAMTIAGRTSRRTRQD